MNPAEASASRATTGQVVPVPRDGDGGPVFEAPWQANAFAVTLALHQRGVFTWTEWASTLAAEIKRAQAAGDPDDGSTYYRHWLSAIERLVVDKGVVTPAHLDARRAAWHRAARATPHGQPILLENDPTPHSSGEFVDAFGGQRVPRTHAIAEANAASLASSSRAAASSGGFVSTTMSDDGCT